MRTAVLFILLTAVGLGQYSKDDKDLVKTTFLRQFNRDVLSAYFSSSNPQRVNAALLSASHSGDTTWAAAIQSVNFKQHAAYAAFALGQLGECFASTAFLRSESVKPHSQAVLRMIFDALGKTAPLEQLAVFAHESRSGGTYAPGTALMLLNGWLRGKKDSAYLRMVTEILADTGQNRKDAVFALYRMGGYRPAEGTIITALKGSLAAGDVFTVQYALGCLRRMKTFPEDPELLLTILKHKNWIVRVEAARAAVFYPYHKTGPDKYTAAYVSLLTDANASVARQAAQSLTDAALPHPNAGVLGSEAIKYLTTKKLTPNTLGELAVSLSVLLPKETAAWMGRNGSKLGVEYTARAVAKQPFYYSGIENIFSALFNKGNEKEKTLVVEAFFALPAEYRKQPYTENFLLAGLQSDFASVAATVAENADSSHFPTKRQDAISAATFTILKNLNNPDFIEIHTALYKFLTRMDSFHADGIRMIMQGSESAAVRKLAGATSTGNTAKQAELFERLWKNAFTYRYAKVTTTKGVFTIALRPELAPVTCGSIAALADAKFFNGNRFHRVVPGFVIQTGDRTQTGWGGPGYAIVSEFSPENYSKGITGIASAGKDTEGSQWFVMNAEHPHLNGRYTVFGALSGGQAIADGIDQGDSIVSVTMVQR